MINLVVPLLKASTESMMIEATDKPDWSADLNYFIPWHQAAEVVEGKSLALYTHCNPGAEGSLRQAAKNAEVIAMSRCGADEFHTITCGDVYDIIQAPVNPIFKPKTCEILVVGAEQPNGRKRSWLLLELAWMMDLSPYHFRIIGTGWGPVVEKLRALGVSVNYTEHLDLDALAIVYANADALLVTGFVEGGSLPILEAIASNIPVLSPEYGYASDYPEVCQVYTSIEELSELLYRMTRKDARERILEKHSEKIYVAAHLKVFRNLMRAKSELTTIKSRYDWVPQIVKESLSTQLLEIGTWTGERALSMIEAAKTTFTKDSITYYGHDMFQPLTKEMMVVENSKQPPDLQWVAARLSHTGAHIHLYAGYSHHTLTIDQPQVPMDFIFVDGGHSWDTIQRDWEAIQPLITTRTQILFDDYYIDNPQGIGCQKLIESLDKNVWRVDYLAPIESWPQPDGSILRIQMIKVQKYGATN